MNPYVIIASLALTIGAFFYGQSVGIDSVRADMADKVKVATENARKEEQAKQEKVNAITQEQLNNINTINDRLNDDLDELRKRPNNRYVSKDNQTTCKGATGKELSEPDSRFLVRLAARADKLRAGLKACYKYADEVSGNN